MLWSGTDKPVRRIVGMMSGTSVDGVDAALVEVRGTGDRCQVKLLAFENRPYPETVREEIFTLFQPEQATVDRVGRMNVLLGELYARSARSVVEGAGLRLEDVDLIGSHGQTIWHSPQTVWEEGFPIHYTVQIGEGAVIAARTGVPTVSDFRVADMAVGGQGAPLVPFTEYLLYRREEETILLQNIGGIGNMTVLPAGAGPEEVYAFDTGPGNMIIDAAVSALTGGEQTYDVDGAMAAAGRVNADLLAWLQQEPYYSRPLPKTTGREEFGTQYTERVLERGRELGLSSQDIVATVTDLTAWSIADAYGRYVQPRYRASRLVVGGGGSYNPTLLAFLSRRLGEYGVAVQTQEDLGWSSDAKEAVAFAVLADRCAMGEANSLPGVTGAEWAAVMGKISLPPRGSGKGEHR